MLKNLYPLLLLQFSVSFSYAQESEADVNMKLRYDSAKIEFEAYEKMHGGFVQTKNVKMHYLEWGNPKDTPLIWMHGSFTNAYELFGIADDIVKNGYRLIAIDYYGHGLTKIPNHEVSLYHVADDIKALMEHKKLSKAIIGGWSRGGIIATAFYDAYPELVLGLILEDGGSVATNSYYHQMSEVQLNERIKKIFKDKYPYPSYESQFDAYKAFYDYADSGTQFTLLAWITQDKNAQWTIGPGVEELFSMSNEEQFSNTILRPTTVTLFAESMSLIEPKIVYRNLAVPLLILDPVSAQDLFPFEKHNEDLKNQHPELIIYKRYADTGHNIHYEKPKMFVKDLAEFLRFVNSFKKTREP